MKTAASYIKKKYDSYNDYSEKSIRDVCHIWCEVIEEAQNDVKKEYEEKIKIITDHVWKKGDSVLLRGDNHKRDVISVNLMTDTILVFGILGEVKITEVQVIYHAN